MKFIRTQSLGGIERMGGRKQSGKALLRVLTFLAMAGAIYNGAWGQSTTQGDAGKKKPTVQADTIVVQDSAVTSEEVAAHELATVAGGTSLINTDQLLKGRVANVADALKMQPGVWAQSQTGAEATRLSIRGSGITRGANLFGWGTQVLIDGRRLLWGKGELATLSW